MGTLANSEDPDKQPRKADFHQGLHSSVCRDKIDPQRKKYNTLFGITTSIYILNSKRNAYFYYWLFCINWVLNNNLMVSMMYETSV